MSVSLIICATCSGFGDQLKYASSVEPNNWREATHLVLVIIRSGRTQVLTGLCDTCFKRISERLEFENRRKEYLQGDWKRNPITGELMEGTGL